MQGHSTYIQLIAPLIEDSIRSNTATYVLPLLPNTNKLPPRIHRLDDARYDFEDQYPFCPS
jgi:hypothetical protein